MEVFQKFSIEHEKFGDLLISYKRHTSECPGDCGIYDLSYWVPSQVTGKALLYAHESELSKQELKLIHDTAATLWDEFIHHQIGEYQPLELDQAQ